MLLNKTAMTLTHSFLTPFEAGTIVSVIMGCISIVLLYEILLNLKTGKIVAFVVSLVFMSSPELIEQATKPEVYTLNLLLTVLAVYVLVRFQTSERKAALSGLVMGLGISHHLLFGVALFPFALIYFLVLLKRGMLRPRLVTAFLIGSGSALLVYLYFPVRSFGEVQLIDWPRVTHLASLLDYVTGAVFRERGGYLPEIDYVSRATEIAVRILTQFPLLLIFLAVAVPFFRKRAPLLGLSLAGGGFVTFLTAELYKIPDYSAYLLPGYFFLAILAAGGLAKVVGRLDPMKRTITVLAVLVTHAIFLWNFGIHPGHSRNWLPLDYATRLNYTLPQNSRIVCHWHYFTALYYNRNILGNRPDVKLVHRSNLSDTSWSDAVEEARKETDNVFLAFPHRSVSKKYMLKQFHFLWKVEEPILRKDEGDIDRSLRVGPLEVEIVSPAHLKPRELYAWPLRFKLESRSASDGAVVIGLVDGETENVLFFNIFRPLHEHFLLSQLQVGEIYEEKVYFYVPALTKGKDVEIRIAYLEELNRLKDNPLDWKKKLVEGQLVGAVRIE